MLLMPRVGALDLRHQDRMDGAWISEDRFAVVPANHAHQTQALRDTHAHLAFYITGEALRSIEAEAGSLAQFKRRTRAVVGEIIASNSGLGFLVSDTAGVFAGLLGIVALAMLLNIAVKQTETWLMPWKAAPTDRSACRRNERPAPGRQIQIVSC